MDKMNNSKGTPTKRTGAKDVDYGTSTPSPNPTEYGGMNNNTNATPSIPQEMPVREGK